MKKIIFTLSFIAALLYTANAQVIAFNTASYSSAVAKQQAFTQSYSSNTPLTLTATTTSVSSGMNPSSVGEKVIFTATVTGKLYIAPGPTGYVDFFDQTTGIDLGMISLDNDGHASLGIATLTAGRHIITAVYSGDANYDASTGYLDNIYQVVNQVENARVTTTSVGSDAMDHSIFLGQNVTFTATVTGQVYVAPGPAGSVDFFDQSTGIDLGMASLDNDGHASINTSTLALGMHIIAAHYSGNADFDASTGYYSNPGLAVYQATITSVGSSLNPSVFGQSVTFTATVTVPSPGTGTPTGSVDFFDQSTGTDLGVVSLDNEGHASVSIATLTEGTHIIEAHYSGDANYIFTTGYYDNPGQVVTKLATTTSVSSSMNPSLVGQNVTFTASVIAQPQVTPGPTGEVTFYDVSTGTPLDKVSLDNDGNASISIATLTAGEHNISALYNGDDNFSSSTGYYDNPGQVVTSSMTFYRDADGDGYGDPNVTIQASSAPTGYVSNNTDCDDTHATVYPGAPELCDGLDNNCNGQIDEGCGNITYTYYFDSDGDGYGKTNSPITTDDATPPAGYAVLDGDCDDGNAAVHPGATEICDGIDNNCDGQIDEGFIKTAYYRDADGDGYGDPNVSVQDCSAPAGYVANNTDCNDHNANIHPKTFYRDADGDSYGDISNSIIACTKPAGYVANKRDCNDHDPTVYPGAPELCDGIDNNCNGRIDENCTFISIADASVVEKPKAQRVMNFTVTLSKKSTQTITVNYATQDGTATAGSDYVAQSGTITFTPGIRKAILPVTIDGDRIPEPDETFTVMLTDAVNATLNDSIATGTIINYNAAIASLEEKESVSGEGNSVAVVPNPASSKVTISLTNYTGNITVRLNDEQGKILQEKKLELSVTKLNQTTLDVSHYANGVYFIMVFDDKGNNKVQKLVVQH